VGSPAAGAGKGAGKITAAAATTSVWARAPNGIRKTAVRERRSVLFIA